MPTDGRAGGSMSLNRVGGSRRYGVIHFGPEPGYCSVDEDGCGYCIGVACRLPKQSAEQSEQPARQADSPSTVPYQECED